VRWAALALAVAFYLGWLYVAWDEVRHNALRRAQQRPHHVPAAPPDWLAGADAGAEPTTCDGGRRGGAWGA